MISFVFPGQGSQFRGMGKALFDEFPEMVEQADDILGYSIKALCLENKDGRLDLTQYTQPALFIVSALSYLKRMQESNEQPICLAGHSLGEFNALHAAGVLDFESGIRLVAQRGLLMSKASDGGMAAVLGFDSEIIKEICQEYQDNNRGECIQIANYNSPSQVVVSGSLMALRETQAAFEKTGAKFIQLNVSAAFHSELMQPVKVKFADYLAQYMLSEPKVPVIANLTAAAYEHTDIAATLTEQITGAVKWSETIKHILTLGDVEFEEIGPGKVLTQLIQKIKKDTPSRTQHSAESDQNHQDKSEAHDPAKVSMDSPIKPDLPTETANSIKLLGSTTFKQRYGLDCAYIAGADDSGVGTVDIVNSIAKVSMLGVLGTQNRSIEMLRSDIISIQDTIKQGSNFAVNVSYDFIGLNADFEHSLIGLCEEYKVNVVEASSYLPHLSQALVGYRIRGLQRAENGSMIAANRVIARVSRPEQAEAFLSPPPPHIVQELLALGLIDQTQADLAPHILMADDICVQSDSAGITDGGVAAIQLPTILRLRDSMHARHPRVADVSIGATGGIGTPESAMVAFLLGADFIMTGSINQCSVESNVCAEVKDMLQAMNIQDTSYVRTGHFLETDEIAQVLDKGVFFPARVKKLSDLHVRHDSFDQIDEETKKLVESQYLNQTFDQAYASIIGHYKNCRSNIIERSRECQKFKMALVFHWYITQSLRWAAGANSAKKLDYQVRAGPALGAFNQWTKGSKMEDWQYRHVDQIAFNLLVGAAEKITVSQVSTSNDTNKGRTSFTNDTHQLVN